MRIIKTNVYKYKELSNKSKEIAKQEFFSHNWDEQILEDCKKQAEMLGFSNAEVEYRIYSGQGDGARVLGHYEYKKGCLDAIRDMYTSQSDFYLIAKELQEFQKLYQYGLFAEIYSSSLISQHERATTIEVYHNRYDLEPHYYTNISELRKLLRRFMIEVYHNIKTEYNYCTSDKNIEESFKINDTWFLSSGKVYESN